MLPGQIRVHWEPLFNLTIQKQHIMDEKTLSVLEFTRVLEKLAGYTSFSISKEMSLQIKPTSDLQLAQLWQRQTSEARDLLSTVPDISIGSAADIRSYLDLAGRGGVLAVNELLEVKNTLICARTLMRSLEHIEKRVSRPGNDRHQPARPIRHCGCHLALHLGPRRNSG